MCESVGDGDFFGEDMEVDEVGEEVDVEGDGDGDVKMDKVVVEMKTVLSDESVLGVE
jgi:hypothetical protein